MFKEILRLFLSGVIAGLIYNFGFGLLSSHLPLLPFGVSGAIVYGILVVIIDYILKDVAHI